MFYTFHPNVLANKADYLVTRPWKKIATYALRPNSRIYPARPASPVDIKSFKPAPLIAVGSVFFIQKPTNISLKGSVQLHPRFTVGDAYGCEFFTKPLHECLYTFQHLIVHLGGNRLALSDRNQFVKEPRVTGVDMSNVRFDDALLYDRLNRDAETVGLARINNPIIEGRLRRRADDSINAIENGNKVFQTLNEIGREHMTAVRCGPGNL